MATVLGQFREPGVCNQVTEVTVDTDGQWIRATTLDKLDELMNDAAFYAYITSSTGAVLEVAADGLRLGTQALDAGLGGGGADKIRLDMGSLSPATNPAGSDQLWLERAGGQYRITYTELLSNIPAVSTDITVTEAPTNVAIDSSSGTGDTIALADAVNSGVMSPADYTKLAGIADSANAYVHPNHTGGDCDSVGDGAITINTAAVVEAKLADSAVTANKLAANAVTTVKVLDANVTEPKLATDAVSTAKIVDANVTLAKLAADARTNLGVTLNSSDVEVTNTTGTNALIPLADGVAETVGLVEGFEKRKLEDTIYVTDYPTVDPTGNNDSSLAIQSAISDAVAKDIRTVKFPKGVYLIGSPIDLPFDSGGAGKRLTLDFCNSSLHVDTDIVMFRRNVTNFVPESQTQNWMLTLINGRFVALGNNIGTAFDIWQCSNVHIANMRAVNLKTFCHLVFCLHHTVYNVNCSDVDFPYQIRGGEGIITGAGYNDSSSNNGTWIAVRCQLTDLAAIGFDSSNSGNITYINCTVEGSAAATAWRHSGNQGSQDLARLNLTMVNCWLEFAGGDLSTAVLLEDLVQSVVEINLFGVQQPDSVVFTKLTGTTKRSTIRWKDTELFQANTGSVGPFFDADIKQPVNEKNRWEFLNCTVQGATETLSDPSRWQSGSNGTVPTETLYESTWQYNGATIYDTNLSIPGASLLVNEGTSTAKVKGQQVNLLPQASPVGGSWLFGESSTGDLSKFDPTAITATSRKDAVSDEGAMTPTQVVDWDSGLYDNKMYDITQDISLVTFTATRMGEYQLWLKNDGTGFHTINFGSSLEPSVVRIGLDPRGSKLTVLRLYYDGSDWHWG